MTATNTNSIRKNRDGYANYQHAPEEQDMDILVVFLSFFFFLRKVKTSKTKLEA